MSAATASERGRAPRGGAPTPPGLRGRPAPVRRGRAQARARLALPALALLLVAAFGLRLWGIGDGLPYAYNSDEAQHFVPVAMRFFSGDFDPHYFLNPPAYSYLVHLALELWFGGSNAAIRAWTLHPGEVFLLARLLSAALGSASVLFTYLAAARLFGAGAALLAAAVYGLAFLPVFYGHLALNDSPTLLPVAVALFAAAGILRYGRRGDYVLAGIATGLAAATKYTGGIVLVSVLFAAAADGARHGWPVAARRAGAAVALGLVAFVIANPYALLAPAAFFAGISKQASAAGSGDPIKLGITPGGGIAYYIWTFTWGIGLVPALAALGGAGLLLWRRRLATAGLLLPAPVAFILFMGLQERYFGRWLMPIFPLVAALSGYGTLAAVRWLARSRRIPLAFATALATVLLIGQSVSADVHNDRVLSRPDTRSLARAWMVAHIPAGSRVVVEPVVPASWAYDIGVSDPATPTGARWRLYPTQLSNLGVDGRPLPAGQRRYVPVDEYERTLQPALIDAYEQEGYCWVVVGSLQASRPFVQPRIAPAAIAYYRALARRGRLVYHLSPFAPGTDPVPFSFDWTIDYYPRQYRLPGPEMWIYRLNGGLCAGAGPSPGV
jgi:hypothetical protein